MARDREDAKAVREEIESTLRVSSYLDKVEESIQTGQEIQSGYVPDLSPGMTASANRGGGRALSNEGQSLFSLDYRQNDYLASVAAESLGLDTQSMSEPSAGVTEGMVKTGANEMGHGSQPQAQAARRVLSVNQINAVKRYPALVELLGTEMGETLAREILAKLNSLVAVKVGTNTQKAHKDARACVADKQNLKQYFVAPNEEWVCIVTASGPFRGDEAFFYSKDKDRANILRIDADGEYQDVSTAFNMIHECVENGNA